MNVIFIGKVLSVVREVSKALLDDDGNWHYEEANLQNGLLWHCIWLLEVKDFVKTCLGKNSDKCKLACKSEIVKVKMGSFPFYQQSEFLNGEGQ